MSVLLRVYEPAECGRDGYPLAWHHGTPAIKDLVRDQAGSRCVRCGHPYAKGTGEWSRCDTRCTHGAPLRVTSAHGSVALFDRLEPEVAADTMRRLLMREHATVEAQWRILTVHHLNGDKADCRWWNLAALCQRCHLTIQGRVQLERVYPWEHSHWFKPYAAGWYAHAYLGQDITRDEAEARLDELLALEAAA